MNPPNVSVPRYLAALAWLSWPWPDGPDLGKYCNHVTLMCGGRLKRQAMVRQFRDGCPIAQGSCL